MLLFYYCGVAGVDALEQAEQEKSNDDRQQRENGACRFTEEAGPDERQIFHVVATIAGTVTQSSAKMAGFQMRQDEDSPQAERKKDDNPDARRSEVVTDIEAWGTGWPIFLDAVEMLAMDVVEQCEAMGNYNV